MGREREREDEDEEKELALWSQLSFKLLTFSMNFLAFLHLTPHLEQVKVEGSLLYKANSIKRKGKSEAGFGYR